MAACTFCKIISGDLPADILYEDSEIVVFKDIKPASTVHILVVPKQHIPNVNNLNVYHAPLLEKLVKVGKEVVAQQGGDVDDLRMGFHQPPFYSVAHLHLHMISPTSNLSFIQRWVFKQNSWWFTSVAHVLERFNKKNKL